MSQHLKYDEQTLTAIDEYWMEFLHPPTIRYLCAETGCSSTSVMWGVLRRLERTGQLVFAIPPTPQWVETAIRQAEVAKVGSD